MLWNISVGLKVRICSFLKQKLTYTTEKFGKTVYFAEEEYQKSNKERKFLIKQSTSGKTLNTFLLT